MDRSNQQPPICGCAHIMRICPLNGKQDTTSFHHSDPSRVSHLNSLKILHLCMVRLANQPLVLHTCLPWCSINSYCFPFSCLHFCNCSFCFNVAGLLIIEQLHSVASYSIPEALGPLFGIYQWG